VCFHGREGGNQRPNWHFDRDKAIVHFPGVEMLDGEFDVDIRYDELKLFMRPDAPVLLAQIVQLDFQNLLGSCRNAPSAR
jgi:hypothetical protein